MTLSLFLLLPSILLITAAPVGAIDPSELEGTRWRVVVTGEDYSGTEVYDVQLHGEGRLYTFDSADQTKENDAWRIEGEQVVILLNDEFAVYTGKILPNGKIKGRGRNVRGVSWEWSATQVLSSAPE